MGVRVRQKQQGGPWWVFATHQGRRTSKQVGDKKAAVALAAKMQAKIALGDFRFEEPQRPPTFRETAERWLESYAKVHCRPSTYDGYRRLLERFAFPRFGTTLFPEISREDLKGLIAEMGARGLSKSTIRFTIAPIRELFNHAIDDGAKLANPAARVGRFFKDKADRRLQITPLNAEEVERLLDAARAFDQARTDYPIRMIQPSAALFLLCAVRTGLRLGELLGLQWGDLDIHGRFIEVRRQYTRGRTELTKSGKIRRVDMSRQLCEAFRGAREIRRAQRAIQGKDLDPGERVFQNGAGSPLDESSIRNRILGPCLRDAGLRHIRFHDLRHTFASLLLANGESLVYVKDQLGHHSIQITVDTYGHLIPGANKAAVDKLDAAPICTPGAPTQRVETREGSQLAESIGGADGIRTRGLLTASQARSQLRHSPTSIGRSTEMI